MIIPPHALEKQTLRAIAESFVLREGTDYGEWEATFEQKVQQVLDHLESGEAVLMYSELHDSVDIRPAREPGGAE
ncbi:YheU family protein [Alteromonas aestuariivivens]|uniref:YheU family protein n=1 Tax=Alteromonas aestuariivivens TaxID=1938339 RepID=A0A3D8M6S3_9ALTE|nr:YheU family protein [Alteromonas aestuariivivens]RDV24862.1 YheU family protein [Alteromonas aestuariivivens]